MKLYTAHFLIFADSAQKEMATYFSELLEKNYLKIHEDFHFPLLSPEKDGQDNISDEKASESTLCCYLCSSIPEYLQQTGKQAEDYEPWMVGYADSRQGKICLLLPVNGGAGVQAEEKENDQAESNQAITELEKIAVHELVHIIFDRHCAVTDGEAWLTEGIAILYADQTDLQYVSEEDCPKIRTLGGRCVNGETPDEFVDYGGYDYAGIYVWYFIRKYGFEQFLAAYRNEIDTCEILPEGFEEEAVAAYRKEAN